MDGSTKIPTRCGSAGQPTQRTPCFLWAEYVRQIPSDFDDCASARVALEVAVSAVNRLCQLLLYHRAVSSVCIVVRTVHSLLVPRRIPRLSDTGFINL